MLTEISVLPFIYDFSLFLSALAYSGAARTKYLWKYRVSSSLNKMLTDFSLQIKTTNRSTKSWFWTWLRIRGATDCDISRDVSEIDVSCARLKVYVGVSSWECWQSCDNSQETQQRKEEGRTNNTAGTPGLRTLEHNSRAASVYIYIQKHCICKHL